MTLENNFIAKTFYQKFIIDVETNNPVQVLAELYSSEHKSDSKKLMDIRFSQGELYFHYKDYESAIFKWKQVKDELEPWAIKNIADAYVELGEFSTAEELYKSIESDSLILNTEVALKLFSIYNEQGCLEKATKVIKNIISINPEFNNVTGLAQNFFEKYGDWSNAIELAVNEAVRTQSMHWYDILNTYVNKGLTKKIEPDYFSNVLRNLFDKSQSSFEKLVLSMWNSYKNENLYFSWIIVFNNLLIELENIQTEGWNELANHFHDTYFELINGEYLIKDLSEIIPIYLSNWMKVTDLSNSKAVSAAVIAWYEVYPGSISSAVAKEAEIRMKDSDDCSNSLEYSYQLFRSIGRWAKNNGVDLSNDTEFVCMEIKPFLDRTNDNKELSSSNISSSERNEQLLGLTRQNITSLYDKRVEAENSLTKEIQWNEEIVSKLNGAMNQLNDLENERVDRIQKSYFIIKEEIKTDLENTIPTLLRQCSALINENSDFGSIHLKLNTEMNTAIKNYIQQTVSPTFSRLMEEWFELVNAEFSDSYSCLTEMGDGLNALYGNEKLSLNCDFQVLNDWNRDIDRMTTIIDIEEIDILSGFKPTLFILKNSGKLFETLPANKTILHKAYKKFIENENYITVTDTIIAKFMVQFELFEKSIERDIKRFFKAAFRELEVAIDEGNLTIDTDKATLNQLQSTPEIYFDSLTLFEIWLKQCELMAKKESENRTASI